MDIEQTGVLTGSKRAQWVALLNRAGLVPEEPLQSTVLIWEEGELVATGSRQDNLLKCIAVDDSYQGQGLTATLLTNLVQDAFLSGHQHLFLYTKPKNEVLFSSLFLYPIAKTDQVLLMENKRRGIEKFLSDLPQGKTEGVIGSAVMNCNPFTKGHRYLIETAARECDWVYVFVLSEDKSRFSAKDRLEMVKRGTADLPNVTVLPTGPYLLSSATFPTYFLKDREKAPQIQCQLDIGVFSQYYAPKFGITRRYVGTEPLSPMTNQYNEALKENLPGKGIELREVPRLTIGQTPISATNVRANLHQEQTLKELLPQTTYQYLKEKGLLDLAGEE